MDMFKHMLVNRNDSLKRLIVEGKYENDYSSHSSTSFCEYFLIVTAKEDSQKMTSNFNSIEPVLILKGEMKSRMWLLVHTSTYTSDTTRIFRSMC